MVSRSLVGKDLVEKGHEVFRPTTRIEHIVRETGCSQISLIKLVIPVDGRDSLDNLAQVFTGMTVDKARGIEVLGRP